MNTTPRDRQCGVEGRASSRLPKHVALVSRADVRSIAPMRRRSAPLVAFVVWFGAPQFGHQWWLDADPDGAYVGSALNILVGNHTGYLDHPACRSRTRSRSPSAPGISPTTSSAARRPGAWIASASSTSTGCGPVYQGFSLLVHLVGALVTYLLLARLLGHWTWGVAAGLLFIAAPKLVEHTYNLRPDTAVAALCLVFVFLVARAFERGSPAHLLGAGVRPGSPSP